MDRIKRGSLRLFEQNSVLEYGRPGPDPRPQDRIIEIATSVVLAVVMFSLALVQFLVFYSDGILATPTNLISISLLTGFGLFLLRPVWRRR